MKVLTYKIQIQKSIYIYRAKLVNVEFHISVLRYHRRYFCSLFIIELT